MSMKWKGATPKVCSVQPFFCWFCPRINLILWGLPPCHGNILPDKISIPMSSQFDTDKFPNKISEMAQIPLQVSKTRKTTQLENGTNHKFYNRFIGHSLWLRRSRNVGIKSGNRAKNEFALMRAEQNICSVRFPFSLPPYLRRVLNWQKYFETWSSKDLFQIVQKAGAFFVGHTGESVIRVRLFKDLHKLCRRAVSGKQFDLLRRR